MKWERLGGSPMFFAALSAGDAVAQESRSFYMGFTPHPHDYTEEAFAATYKRIAEYGDIIAHHLDEVVPWQESLDGTDYPKAVMTDLNRRKRGTPAGKKVFLSVTPLSLTRVDRLESGWRVVAVNTS